MLSGQRSQQQPAAAVVLPTLLRIGSRLLLMRVEEKEKKNEIKKLKLE